jgi:hypothetical protein
MIEAPYPLRDNISTLMSCRETVWNLNITLSHIKTERTFMIAERTDFELQLMLRLLWSYFWLPRVPILLLQRCYHGYSFTTSHYVNYFVRRKTRGRIELFLTLIQFDIGMYSLRKSLSHIIEILSKQAYSGKACLCKTIDTMITQPILFIFNLILFVCFWHDSPAVGQGLLIPEVSRSHTTTHHSQ